MEGKLKYPVITISREYAAYGRTIAAGLSNRLGIRSMTRTLSRKPPSRADIPKKISCARART